MIRAAEKLDWPELRPATDSHRAKDQTRCLILSEGRVLHRQVSDMTQFLDQGDVVVVNDAGTLPASLMGATSRGEKIEFRLVKPVSAPNRWWAIAFGDGDWRTPTEKRAPAPPLEIGEQVEIGPGFSIQIHRPLFLSRRMFEIEIKSEEIWNGIFKYGRPIQYSYLSRPLDLWDQQTAFAGPPVSLEPPSAAFCMTWRLVGELKAKGVKVVSLTHPTGISSTGDERLDRMLPLPERCWIPSATAETIRQAKAEGRRVVAIGTGTVRALEGIPRLQAGEFEVNLKISKGWKRRIVDGLLTGLHDRTSSHLDLLESFAKRSLLLRAYNEAAQEGYRIHEYGDVNLIL